MTTDHSKLTTALLAELKESIPPANLLRSSRAVTTGDDPCGATTKTVQQRPIEPNWHKFWCATNTKSLAQLIEEPTRPLGEHWGKYEIGHTALCLNGMFGSGKNVYAYNLELFDFSKDELSEGVDNTMSKDNINMVLERKPYNRDDYVAIVVHSAVYVKLMKNGELEHIKSPDGNGEIATFQGLYVIVNDSCRVGWQQPQSRWVYKSYLLAKNSINITEVEVDNPVVIGDTENAEFTRSYNICPRGMKFEDTVVNPTPFLWANDMSNPDNWQLSNAGDLGVVCIITNE